MGSVVTDLPFGLFILIQFTQYHSAGGWTSISMCMCHEVSHYLLNFKFYLAVVQCVLLFVFIVSALTHGSMMH